MLSPVRVPRLIFAEAAIDRVLKAAHAVVACAHHEADAPDHR
jgi:hypothetical protein